MGCSVFKQLLTPGSIKEKYLLYPSSDRIYCGKSRASADIRSRRRSSRDGRASLLERRSLDGSSKMPSFGILKERSSFQQRIGKGSEWKVSRNARYDLANWSGCKVKKHADIKELYEISNKVIGTGISGPVKIVINKSTRKEYALKTLSLKNVSLKRAAMLRNEVSVYLKLDHPNIAKLVEVYESREAIRLVMEMCVGGELYDHLAVKQKYSEQDAIAVTKQMLSAINYCHKHQICHRDLKLENWVYADVQKDAPLKLIDFGFSRIFVPGIPMTAMRGTLYYVSPEVMDGCYAEKCDIWSIGVIVYMLLSGIPPFHGSCEDEVLFRIKRGVVSFPESRWSNVSERAKDFVKSLLVKNPEKRPSAADALQHPWIKEDFPTFIGNDINLSALTSMRNFARGSTLRRAVFDIVASSITYKEISGLEKVFQQLDRNYTGCIQLEDLVGVLIETLNIDISEAKQIFQRIDHKGKHELNFSEFIASTLQAVYVKDTGLIQETFRRFDRDNKNFIDLKDLRSMLGDSYDGMLVEDVIKFCDTDHDGVIDYQEFCKALTSDEMGPSILEDEKSEIEVARKPANLEKPFQTSHKKIEFLPNSEPLDAIFERDCDITVSTTDTAGNNNLIFDATHTNNVLRHNEQPIRPARQGVI